MRILGIETSCDETAAAVVEATGDAARPWRVCASVVASQTEIHREWGGVVPELASRQHLRDICGVVESAMAQATASVTAPASAAGTTAGEVAAPASDAAVPGSAAAAPKSAAVAPVSAAAPMNIDAVAVTQGPGLVGALLVGVSFAKAFAAARGLPIVGVHHLAGHIESLTLEHGELPLPAVVLIVSGGHTSLYFVPRVGDYQLVGQTRDDAAGEGYDKVARVLGLGYPGGPVIDRLAASGRDDAVALPLPRFTHPDRNAPAAAALSGDFAPEVRRMAEFSFSGLKTAAIRQIETHGVGRVEDFCASFQRVVVTTLVDRLFRVADALGAKSVGIAGGVSANRRLRADAIARGEREGIPVFVPSLALSTDNAAMIAAAGLRRLAAHGPDDLDFNAAAGLRIDR